MIKQMLRCSRTTGLVAVGSACVLLVLAATSSSDPPSSESDTDDSAATQQADDPQDAEDDAESKWTPPTPKSIDERLDDRERMVRTQMAGRRDGAPLVEDEDVLAAMRTVPRHVFVSRGTLRDAYADSPLPIGHGQTISQPYIVAMMTELLELTPKSKVLEIGTGSGYQAAVLGQLTPHVYTVEIIKPLAKRADKVLESEGYADVKRRHTDGYHGWAEHAPFDAIIVTCAAGHLPPPLWKQLKPGGRIVIPIGGTHAVQRLVVVTKTEAGERRSRTVMAVRFVPMTGQVQSDEPDEQ